MKKHIITENTKLPPNIALVEGETIEKALKNMFSAFYMGSVNVAVWNGAENLVHPLSRQVIQKRLNEVPASRWQELNIASVFNAEASDNPVIRARQTAFRNWHHSTQQIKAALAHTPGGIGTITEEIRTSNASDRAHFRHQSLPENGGTLSRTVFGEAPLYVNEHSGFVPQKEAMLANWTPEEVWTPKPWALVLTYNAAFHRPLLESEPVITLPVYADRRKATETLSFCARNDVLSSYKPGP